MMMIKIPQESRKRFRFNTEGSEANGREEVPVVWRSSRDLSKGSLKLGLSRSVAVYFAWLKTWIFSAGDTSGP